jgi:hypothetical protein
MQCYTREDLLLMEDLTVAVVGAATYEVFSGDVMEEVMHLLPQVKRLHVAFVGGCSVDTNIYAYLHCF